MPNFELPLQLSSMMNPDGIARPKSDSKVRMKPLDDLKDVTLSQGFQYERGAFSSAEFTPNPEIVAEVHAIFRSALHASNLVIVPESLIQSILRKQPDVKANGLHIPAKILGVPNPMLEEYWNYALGWGLDHKLGEEAQSLAREVIYKGKIMLAVEVSDEEAVLERKRLALHELLHKFFELLMDSQKPEIKAIAKQMKDAYNAIPLEERGEVEAFLVGEGYLPQQRAEEFWTYYLSSQHYPPKGEYNPVEALDSLGRKNVNLQAVLGALPFLSDSGAVRPLIETAVAEAKVVVSQKE